MLDSLPKGKPDTLAQQTEIVGTNSQQAPDQRQQRIDAAIEAIDETLRPIKTADKALVTYIPEKGTNVSLPSPNGSGDTFKASVVDIRKNGDQVEVVLQAGADYPGEPNKQLTIPASQFENQFKQQIENNARYEAVMDNIAQSLLEPALATKTPIDSTTRSKILKQATDLLMKSEQDEHLLSTANELNAAIDEHNVAIENEAKFQAVMNSIASEILDPAFAGKKLLDAAQIDAIQKAALQKLKAANLNSYTEEVRNDITELVIAHNKDLEGKASASQSAEPEKDTKSARMLELEQVMSDHPELESRIGALDKKVRDILASKAWANDSQRDPLAQISSPDSPVTAYLAVLNEAQDLPGMTPSILQALKNKWGKEINRQAELAPALIKLDSTIRSYLAKTETIIDEHGLQEIALAISAVPTLSTKQKDFLLADASKKIKAHNNAILSRTQTVEPMPPIEVQDNELEDAPEATISDPDFAAKLDDLDAAASKLLQSLSTGITSHTIDLTTLSNLLNDELKKQNLKSDSTEAKAWLAGQMETAHQINHGIEALNQTEEKTREIISSCHSEIDALLADPALTTLEEKTGLQNKISLLDDGPEKTELTNRLLELNDHDQAILKADSLIETVLGSSTEINDSEIRNQLNTILPQDIAAAYWDEAQRMIDDHNTALTKPESTDDIATNDRLVSECNDQFTELIESGEPVSLEAIAELQAKINSITDTETKTNLQKYITELQEYNVALKQADQLIETANATKTAIDGTVIKEALLKLIPTAFESYWLAAEEIINEHNASLAVATPDTGSPENVTTDPAPTVVDTQTNTTEPQSDVVDTAPATMQVDTPIDVLNKVDATPLSAEQIAKRDQMFDLIEKNLILNEQEKGRLMAKVMDLVRTATRDTNIIGELQKLVTDNGIHQESQRQLKEEGPIFAAVIQSAVQSALNTNDLDYRKNDADYQKMLTELPTDEARTAMKAVYEDAIASKKLRENSKALQARVDAVLANQANFADKRGASLQPLFERMNVIIKTGLSRESQVLGSQTIAPDLKQWEAPQATEQQDESFRAKAKRRFLELVDRIRGKKVESVAVVDTANDINEAFIKTPAEMVDFLVASNADLTAEERAALRKTAIEQLEKGTDVSKTIEKLKTALTDRTRINREIATLVLNAPELSKRMYFALSAALDQDQAGAKRQEALAQWQSFVDELPTARAKTAVKEVYQAAMKDKNLRGNVNALEEMLTDKLADHSDASGREQALHDLINALGNEINRAIKDRKPAQAVVDQTLDSPKAAESTTADALADTPDKNGESVDSKLEKQFEDGLIALNLFKNRDKQDIPPKSRFEAEMDMLIKTLANENDSALNDELKVIRQTLVDANTDTKIGNEALDRLTKALTPKYPKLLKLTHDFIEDLIEDHNNRVEMQSEIKAKTTELLGKVETLSSDDISREIKALYDKFTKKPINKFAVDQALFPLNDQLRDAMHINNAVKAIDQLWKAEPTLALDKVSTILSNNQLDQTIMTRLVAFARNIAPIINAATNEKRSISQAERGKVVFELMPTLPQNLKSALVTKVNTMFDNFNKNTGDTYNRQAA